MKTDTLFYHLFQTEPSLALELAGLTVPTPRIYRFGSHEIKQTAFRLDGVLEPPTDQPDSPLVFVEVQLQPDEAFYLRFFGEIILYLRQYNPVQPWLALVFYPYAQIYKLPTITREEIQTMFGLRDIDLKQTRFYRDTFNEGRQEGLEEGIEKGVEKGIEKGVKKGRAEGEAALLLRILDRRFGPLSNAVRERIAATDADTLLVYGERMLDAKGLDDIFADPLSLI